MTWKRPLHSVVTLHCKVSQTLILIRRKTSMQAQKRMNRRPEVRMRGIKRRESWKVFKKYKEVGIILKNKLLAVSEKNGYTHTAPIYDGFEQNFSTVKYLSHTGWPERKQGTESQTEYHTRRAVLVTPAPNYAGLKLSYRKINQKAVENGFRQDSDFSKNLCCTELCYSVRQ